MTRTSARNFLIFFGAVIAPIVLMGLLYASAWNTKAQPAVAVQTVNGASNEMTAYTVQTVATISGGTFTGTWPTAFPVAPSIVLVPIVTGANAVECELTATPSTTGFQGRCWTASSGVTLNLSIITAGINLAPNAASAAGIPVEVIGMSPSQ